MPRIRIPRFSGDVEKWIRDYIREAESHDQIHMHRELDLTRALELQDGEGRPFFFQQTKPRTRRVSLSGASVTLIGYITPSVVYGCFTQVIEDITGATGFHIGTPSDTDAWGNNLPIAAPSRSSFQHYTDRTVAIHVVNEDVVITAVGGSFTGGELEVTLHYSDFRN